jgi:hypothetical protein
MDKTRVAIVVDPEYGGRRRELSLLHPSSMVASQVNSEAARASREEGTGDITTFYVTDPESRVENLRGFSAPSTFINRNASRSS